MFFRSGIADGSNELTSICAGSINGPLGRSTSAVWFADDAADHVRIDHRPGGTIEVFAGQPPR